MQPEYNVVPLAPVPSARLLPPKFFDAVMTRYLPVLSFTFFNVVAGVALSKGGVMGFPVYFLSYKEAYEVALAVCAWISVPAVLWILLKCGRLSPGYADTWYAGTSGMMVSVLLFTVFLFPAPTDEWLKLTQMAIIAAIPMHVIQYALLVRRGLPLRYATACNLVGLSMVIYGFGVVG